LYYALLAQEKPELEGELTILNGAEKLVKAGHEMNGTSAHLESSLLLYLEGLTVLKEPDMYS
jgi:hypothetical protein